MSSIIALLHGPDRPGLVARVAGWIFARGGNVQHADQHQDGEAGVFFQRVVWTATGVDLRAEAEAFREMATTELGMAVRVALSTDRPRVALFVSKQNHCFHDLVLRA